ncbi:MAG: serine/threonine protein kinase [Deltaproteobacteria bacterium]|nr:MAG: serine/threonine protein kinase [Deltaproteobacteria bacterium]
MLNRSNEQFEIVEILGEGSFGTVCVARYVRDGRRQKVALKILKGAYTRNEKILKRTYDEAALLSFISHPNVVRVHELTVMRGRPVVVMELVEGVSLDQLLLRFKTGLPASVAIEVTRQTLVALHVAFNEARGPENKPLRVIHRDIKPSNMLLSTRGELKVADFGIAKGEFDGREARTESVVLGSRPYMAPERLDGVDDHPTVDVYSCGMSLYELLTGRTMGLSINPVTHEQAMNRQLSYLQVPGMSETGVEDIRGIIRRMCAYDRDYRPSSLEAARELEQCFYSIDAKVRVNLEEFASTTVLPIYESRPRIKPEDAVQDESESDFIREVTGQIKSNTITMNKPATWIPQVIVGVLLLVILILGPMALYKFLSGPSAPPASRTTAQEPAASSVETEVARAEGPARATPPVQAAPLPTPASPPPAPIPAEPSPAPPTQPSEPATVAARAGQAAREPIPGPEEGGKVHIEFHPPPRGRAFIGETELRSPAAIQLNAGSHDAVIMLRRKAPVRCTFQAGPDSIVRYVESSDGPSLYVSGEPGPLCEPVEP